MAIVVIVKSMEKDLTSVNTWLLLVTRFGSY